MKSALVPCLLFATACQTSADPSRSPNNTLPSQELPAMRYPGSDVPTPTDRFTTPQDNGFQATPLPNPTPWPQDKTLNSTPTPWPTVNSPTPWPPASLPTPPGPP